jgi:hypothetical protein
MRPMGLELIGAKAQTYCTGYYRPPCSSLHSSRCALAGSRQAVSIAPTNAPIPASIKYRCSGVLIPLAGIS